TYTTFYHLWSPLHFQLLSLAFVKCAIGISPALLLCGVAWIHRRPGGTINSKINDFRLLNAIFGLLYLYLVIGRGSATGFQLIPPCFAFFLVASSYMLENLEAGFVGKTGSAFACVFLIVLATSVVRYQRYVSGINGSAQAYQELLLTKN